jgi:hypothetical protein
MEQSKTFVIVNGEKHFYKDYPPPDGYDKLPTIAKSVETKGKWLRFWETEGVKADKLTPQINSTTHYICSGCEKIFVDRHGGTIILTGLHNIRMIGMLSQCLSVLVLKNEKSEKIEERRSPRFHSSACLKEWFEKMINSADAKLANPKEEDLR